MNFSMCETGISLHIYPMPSFSIVFTHFLKKYAIIIKTFLFLVVLGDEIVVYRKNYFDCLQDTGLLDLGFVI